MAEVIALKAPVDDPRKDLEAAAFKRLAACRTWKSYWELDFKECYFLTAPHRQRQISSMVIPGLARMLDYPELNTDQGFLIVQDFVTEIVQTFMPEAQEWCERGAGMDLPDGVWDKIKDMVRAADKKIFGAMKSSNLYPEITKAFYPDLAIGTIGMWIKRPHPAAPIVVSAIPLRELEINLGPYGEIDDRFAVRYPRNEYVRELLGEDIWAKVPQEDKDLYEKKPTERTQVAWGFWRRWADKSDECWQHVVLVGEKMIHDCEIKGEGCCPLLVARFNPSADWPWGLGPLIQGLPTFRQIDEMEMMRMEHAELSIKPPIGVPNSSFTNMEQGLEPGMAYPIEPGTEGAIKRIYDPPPPDAANYQYEDKVKHLRKLFFVDYPEQTGDTPPTLGQWLDELARAQRRIGTPGMPFWREGPAQIFLRFKYLLEAAGTIPPVQVNGRTVALLPYNPAQRAAEQQEIATAFQFVQFASQAWPEEFKAVVDGKASMEALRDKMRVTLIATRSPQDVAKAITMIGQLVKAHAAGSAPGQPTPQSQPQIGP